MMMVVVRGRWLMVLFMFWMLAMSRAVEVEVDLVVGGFQGGGADSKVASGGVDVVDEEVEEVEEVGEGRRFLQEMLHVGQPLNY